MKWQSVVLQNSLLLNLKAKLWAILTLLFVCLIFLFWVLGRPVKTNELRVAFPYNKPASFYDPLKIYLSPEYTFLENTFSPLVEYTPMGELVSAVAEQFFWDGNKAIFKMRPNLKTIDGIPLNAYDAEISFKRMMILSGNTHGDLKNMLCPDTTLKSLADQCPGMEVLENGATLVLSLNEKKIFLFPMLAAMDFAIIPRKSINPETLQIIDYRNTSGPYCVEKDLGKGEIILTANPNHFHYSKQIPQSLRLVPSTNHREKESIDLFLDNKIDLITTIDNGSSDLLIDFVKRNPSQASLHSTYPLRTYALTFTKKGRKKTSAFERILIGKKMKLFFGKLIKEKAGYEQTDQLFPTLGEASLEPTQIENVSKAYAAVDETQVFDTPMRAWVVRMKVFDVASPELAKNFPNIEFKSVDKIPAFTDFSKSQEQEPDFIVSGPDMGFLEDIGLISYYINADFFYFSKNEGSDWLRKYMSVKEKKERLNLIRELHYKTLVEGISIPMALSPYTAVIRKPWKMNLSKIQASDAIWRIFQE